MVEAGAEILQIPEIGVHSQLSEKGNLAVAGIAVGKAETESRRVVGQKAAGLGERCWRHPGKNSTKNTLQKR